MSDAHDIHAGSQHSDEGEGSTPKLRRSGRPRRSATQLVEKAKKAPATSRDKGKGKQADGSASEAESEMLVMDDDEDDEEELPSDASSGEEFAAPKSSRKAKGAAGARKSAGSKTPAKRARQSTGSAAEKRKRGKAAAGKDDGSETEGEGRGKKAKTAGGAKGRQDKGVAVEQAAIEKDNIFFNALFSNAALSPIIEEWAEKYEDEEDDALWELVVFCIRSAGSSAAIEKEKAVDLDGVPSFVDDLEKEESLGLYPLVSRDKTFRHFHSSLTSFIHSLIHHVSLSDALYCATNVRSEPSPLVSVLTAWLFTLSHSPLRSFRHTGTVIALDVMTGLVEALKDVNEELSVVSRQKESERKKAGANSKEGKERIKELDKKMKGVHWKKGKLEEYLQEFFDTVFVMRYRDLDEKIRSECVKHLGLWMRTLPSLYLESTYFKYLGWMLDDIHAPTRLETVRALSALYAVEAHLTALSTFTERFKSRLLEIAFHDVDLSVRTTTIAVLGHVDKAGLLDDEKRSQIGLLVFDIEPRIRKAVAPFFAGLWEDETQEVVEALEIDSSSRKGKGKESAAAAGEGVEEALRKRIAWKSLAAMLVRFSTALDDAAASGGHSNGDDEEAVKGLAEAVRLRMSAPPKGRITAAVESLWEQVDGLREWEDLVDFLGLDHSSKDNGGDVDLDGTDDDRRAEQAWKLEPDEETHLVQVLLAGLGKAKEEADKADEDSNAPADLTRSLIKHFPRLLTHYQGEPSQLADILAIPRLMVLDTYLDLRMITAYETLWDDLMKTYLKNSDFAVLNSALLTIRHMLDTDALANSNSTKVAELEEALFTSLSDVLGDRNVATTVFEEDEIPTLEAACKRIGLLLSFRPAFAAMEESDSDPASGWSLLLNLANRGSLGYQEEGTIVDECLESLMRFIFHSARAAETEEAQTSVIEKRSALHDLLEEYTIGTQSNAIEAVRRTSFRLLLTLYIFCNPIPADDSHRKASQSRLLPPALHLTLDEQVQWRCTGFVQAEIDKYAEELSEAEAASQADEEFSEDGSSEIAEDDDGEARSKSTAKKAAKKKTRVIAKADPADLSEAALQSRWRFNYLITTFIQGVLSEVLALEHAAVVLAHFGRFGPEYDELCKRLVEYIKLAACYGSSADAASRVIVKALQDAFNLFMDGDIEEDQLLALAKVLSGILVVSGPHFKILAKLPSDAFTGLHTTLVGWLLEKAGRHHAKGNKPKLRKALGFFKTLVPLLAGAVGKDALAIHTHLAEALETNGLKASGEKMWDAEKAYDRRLTTIMSKDSKIAKGARKQVAAEADASPSPPTSPTGAAGKRKRSGRTSKAAAGSGDEDDYGGGAKKKPRPKPKPRGRKSKEVVEESAEEEDDASMAEEEFVHEDEAEEMINMGDSPMRPTNDSQLPPPPSSPLSQEGSGNADDDSMSQASIVVSKRKSLQAKV